LGKGEKRLPAKIARKGKERKKRSKKKTYPNPKKPLPRPMIVWGKKRETIGQGGYKGENLL